MSILMRLRYALTGLILGAIPGPVIVYNWYSTHPLFTHGEHPFGIFVLFAKMVDWGMIGAALGMLLGIAWPFLFMRGYVPPPPKEYAPFVPVAPLEDGNHMAARPEGVTRG